MMNDLLQTLRSGLVLVMDGAMGTEIQRRGGDLRATPTKLTTSIHRDYTNAGAQVILTNTFQVNPGADRHHALWRSAIQAARAATTSRVFVLGDVGPWPNAATGIAAVFRECRTLDGVLLETWSSLTELRKARKKSAEDLPPLFVSFTFDRTRKYGWRTFTGASPEGCARTARQCGAAAIGVNCGRELDMKNMLEVVKRYHDVSALPVFVRPNAGTPTKTAKGWVYPRSPEEMASNLLPLLEEGIAMVGGCCGTTPGHIRAFTRIVEEWNGRAK